MEIQEQDLVVRDGCPVFNRDIFVFPYSQIIAFAPVGMEMPPQSFAILVLGIVLS